MQNNKGIAKTFGICMNADVIIGPKYNLFEMLHYQDQKILTEKYPFYYHSDHLGSTTYLTVVLIFLLFFCKIQKIMYIFAK